MLPRAARLSEKSDFIVIRKYGAVFRTPYYKLSYRPRQAAETARVGVIVSNECGNAVQRNKIKRRIRAIFRRIYPQLKPVDLVFIAREKIKVLPFQAQKNEIEKALSILRLISR